MTKKDLKLPLDIWLRFLDTELKKSYQQEVDMQNSAGFEQIKWFIISMVSIEFAFKMYERIKDDDAVAIAYDSLIVIAAIVGYLLGLIIKKRFKIFEKAIDLIYLLLYCYGSFYLTTDMFNANAQSETGYEFFITGIQSVWIQLFFFTIMKNWIYKVLLVAANIIIISLRTIGVPNYPIPIEVYLKAAASASYTIFLLYTIEKINPLTTGVATIVATPVVKGLKG